MPLDFSQSAVRIDEMAAMAGASASGREDRFRRAVDPFEAADIGTLMSKLASGNSIPWSVDEVFHSPEQRCGKSFTPDEYGVAAEGSYIDFGRRSSAIFHPIGTTDVVILYRPDADARARMSHQASSLFGDDLLTGEAAPSSHRTITQVSGFI